MFRLTAFALSVATFALCSGGVAQAGAVVSNDMSKCDAGKGPAVLVSVRGLKTATGRVRIEVYPATKAAWLAKKKWINRIKADAAIGSMSVCMPVPAVGNYGIAVFHDRNGNGKVDIGSDGGGMSNNPAINIFNLGKPGVEQVRFYAGPGVTRLTINMRYKFI